MKTAKGHIRLSPDHPTLMTVPLPEPGIYAPLVVSEQKILVDGYRRFFLQETEEVETITMKVDSIFHAAVRLNLHSRKWDQVDSLFWTRWAGSLGVEPDFPSVPFPPGLLEASDAVMSSLAHRTITIRQAVLIQRLPEAQQSFFLDLLGSELLLNANESALLLEWMYDLMNQRTIRNPDALLQQNPFASILEDGRLHPKQKGERLLKEMRKLRYPKYQERLVEFSDGWNQLELDSGIRAGRELFLQRGVLELTITASSPGEFRTRVKQLSNSLGSAGWSKIWKK